MILILLIIQLSRTVDLHLSKALFSLDPYNLQLHCFLGLGALFCCSFFCSLDQSCKTFQTVRSLQHRTKKPLAAHFISNEIKLPGGAFREETFT